MTTEQAVVASAIHSWKLNIERADKLFSALSDERLTHQVAPGKNRLVYLWGHLIAVHDAMFPLIGLGPRKYPELDAIFLTEADNATAELPSATTLKKAWDDVHSNLLSAFEGLSASAWLEKHTVVSAEDFAKNPLRNRLSILLSRTVHVGYHLGQCVLAPK